MGALRVFAGFGFLVGVIVFCWHAVGFRGNTCVLPGLRVLVVFEGFWFGVGVVVENCIVDASIFGLIIFCFVSV